MGNVCFNAPDSPKKKNDRRVFFFIALGLWALALVFLYHALQIRSMPTTEAVVSSVLRGRKNVVAISVQYEVEGQSYTSTYNGASINKSKGSFEKGDRVIVAYDPNAPEQIYARNGTLGLIIAFLFLFGLALLFISRYPQQAIRTLVAREKERKASKDRQEPWER